MSQKLVNKYLFFYFYIKRFEKTSVDFDISLIKLKQPINKENAYPICMPKSFVSQDRGAFCMIAGYLIKKSILFNKYKFSLKYLKSS